MYAMMGYISVCRDDSTLDIQVKVFEHHQNIRQDWQNRQNYKILQNI